ncbi:reverse transcriptase domain-containing protein [Tanacetum coccineum]
MLTMEEMLAKFIDEGKREHEEMEIFIKEFRTTNELLLKERSNLLSEMKIEVNELSKVMSNVLIPKYKVNEVTIRGGKMTSEAVLSKEINETEINKNEPPRFEPDVQEKPHDVGVKNKSSSIRERTTEPLVKAQQSSIPFPNQSLLMNKSRLEEAFMEIMNERCSAVVLNELSLKEKDLKSFTIPCQVLEKYKEVEDLVADHLSRFENPHMEVLTEREIANKFSDEHLMVLKSKFNNDEPWYADFVNYIVGKDLLVGIIVLMLPQRRFTSSDFIGLVSLRMQDTTNMTRMQRSGNISSRNEMPQNNIQAIKHILERSMGYNPKDWSKKLNDALWAFRTAYKTLTGCTPFRLVYGKACHLPVVIEHKAHWALKQCNMDLMLASESRLMQLNELAELEDGAYENTRIYKKRTKKWDDSRLRDDKDFKVGDKVYPYGAVEIINKNGFNFKVNGQRLKKYYEGDIDKEDDEVYKFANGVMTLLEKKSTLLVKYLQYGILAHKLNLENLPGKYQGSFSF